MGSGAISNAENMGEEIGIEIKGTWKKRDWRREREKEHGKSCESWENWAEESDRTRSDDLARKQTELEELISGPHVVWKPNGRKQRARCLAQCSRRFIRVAKSLKM